MTGVRSQQGVPRFGPNLTGDSFTRWAKVAMLLPLVATLIWAVQGGPQDAKLDTTDTQLVLKGQYLFQFAKGNDWPEASKSGPFVLAVHNKPALAEELATKYSNNPIGSQPLTVQSISDASELDAPHVLYSEAEGDDLKALLSAVKGEPTLVVTALQPSLLSGVCFNLIKQGTAFVTKSTPRTRKSVASLSAIDLCHGPSSVDVPAAPAPRHGDFGDVSGCRLRGACPTTGRRLG